MNGSVFPTIDPDSHSRIMEELSDMGGQVHQHFIGISLVCYSEFHGLVCEKGVFSLK